MYLYRMNPLWVFSIWVRRQFGNTKRVSYEKVFTVHRVADYSVVTFEAPDLSDITDNGKEVLRLYRYAADVVDSIYWQQYFGDRQALLSGIEDPYQKTFAEINYGPWDRFDGKSFVDGYNNI